MKTFVLDISLMFFFVVKKNVNLFLKGEQQKHQQQEAATLVAEAAATAEGKLTIAKATTIKAVIIILNIKVEKMMTRQSSETKEGTEGGEGSLLTNVKVAYQRAARTSFAHLKVTVLVEHWLRR
ncbi:hypothetical protein PoB_000689000 [Plakobranchus ocellatus]|uniref:Uncharacterized protein n=1 Tax=Plakobranchus ocellatus TaxID=259542 RepID=A0AAV3YCD1_9GAST|nr:hypothetical protein PoB_000689000 [Plakobranchus ocellatus]